MAKKTTHKIKLLKLLLKGEIFISNDRFASNANQYPRAIKNQGIELIEWYDLSQGRHLFRKLNSTPENIERAEKYLKKLVGESDEFFKR